MQIRRTRQALGTGGRDRGRRHGDLIAAIDAGGSKYACAIASLSDAGGGAFEPDVLGIGQHAAPRNGSATEREDALRSAIDSAERMAGETISSVVLLVGGRSIASRRVAVDLALPRGVVAEEDVRDCLAEASMVGGEDRRLLSVSAIAYRLDGEAEREPPIGLAGSALCVEALAVDARASVVDNLRRAVERCGLSVGGVIARPRGAAAATVIEDEKDLGALVLDLGARSTEFAVFEGGALTACGGVALGADHITRDIAQIFGATLAAAERVKTLHGAAFTGPNDECRIIDFPQIGDPSNVARHSRAELAEVIEPRIEEIIALSLEAATRAGARTSLLRRVVATGGGALMVGMVETLERVIGARARLGRPTGFIGAPEVASAPQFSASLGALKLIAAGEVSGDRTAHRMSIVSARASTRRPVRGLRGVGAWIRENF